MAAVIAAEKTNLIARWRERVRGTLDPTFAPTEQILDSLPGFIDELIARLEAGESSPSDAAIARTRAIGISHGAERFKVGFNMGTVIREYALLQNCLLDLFHERQLSLDVDQLRIVLTVFNAGVESAAVQFARERDQALERQSRQHFGFIAHELRNPLGSALLAAQTLRRRAGGDQDVAVQRLVRNLAILQRLVDSSLVSVQARRASEDRELELAEVSLGAIVEDARSEMAADAEAKRLTVALDGDARVQADRRLVRSAISNLMRNAVKYTREGGRIEVRVRAGEQVASVEVEDECGGLPEGKTEELFTPFVQRGNDRTGFGLGLAIAKDAVEAHQGTVQVSNLPGKGCVFMLSFPLPGPALRRG
ncbi:MAG TPA: HAMP domain-containing sensor histidine kinase [Polyangia bacterium]|nr:HAMP domain-containing sensor histidine kinase [Polyangia bacterium]